MTAVNQTRANLRASIQRKTDGGLTDSTDQDYYLDAGEQETLPLWYEFDPDLFAKVRQSAATDSSGILLLPVDWLDTLRIEDANGNRIENIELDQANYSSGYYATGYDIATGKRKLMVRRAGEARVSETLYFYTREKTLMGALTSDSSILPGEFRDLIAYRGAQLYFEDQGPSFYDAAEKRRIMFERRLQDAKRIYEKPNMTPQFSQTFDPDATQGGGRITGTLGYYP